MKILITGGAGFIGSHIAKKLILTTYVSRIYIFDNFSSGSLDHLAEIIHNPKLKIIKGDLKNLHLIKTSMKNVNLVIHLAANPDISKAVKQPNIDFWEGTYLTQNVLEAMRLNRVKNILYSSGSGIYGEKPNIKFYESYGPCFPISTYGASKLASEALISSYCHMFGMIGRAFRFANVVGPKQTHGVGYDFIKQLKKNPKQLRILGNGKQSKSYIYVDDVINALFIIYKKSKNKKTLPFDVFNVATEDNITVKEIADVVVHTLGLKRMFVKYKFTGGDRGWKGDVPKVYFDVSKIKKFGWKVKKNSRKAIEVSILSMKDKIN